MHHLQTLILAALMGLLVLAMPLRMIVASHEAFLEGDSDSGGESDVGNTAVSVANGLVGSVGAGSAALNNKSSGSTAAICALFGCAAAAQSDGNVSTTTSGAKINITGPIINIWGPIVIISKSLIESIESVACCNLTAANIETLRPSKRFDRLFS